MSFASGFGFAGDFLTLVGGLFLAWDAMTGEVDFVKFSKTSRTLKDPVMEGVKLRKNKMVVVDEKDLEQASLRVKSWRANLVRGICLSLRFALDRDRKSLKIRAKCLASVVLARTSNPSDNRIIRLTEGANP
jgi:hypothetical protein